MSNFEIFLIVMVCAVPVLALLFVLPKFKKKEKKAKAIELSKTYSEIKSEEKVEPKKETPKEAISKYVNNHISPDEFKSYLKDKKTTKPSRIEFPADFKDRTMPYTPRRNMMANKKPNSVAEEIRSLSPELKAMLIAGILDKKDYD